MQSVPISIINGNSYPIFQLTVPVLDQNSIMLRVQDFLNKKSANKEDSKKKMSECRKLFQKNNCELFAFPNKKSHPNALSCGELFLCPFFQNTGVVLCFFPLTDDFPRPTKQTNVATSIFQGTDYPEFHDPFTAFFSLQNVSFLIFEEGSINTNTANNCTLSGVKFTIMKHRNVRPTLLCKKTNNRQVTESSILVKEANFAHQRNENYILINCLSKEKGFCIPLKFPILTEQAVKEKILYAQMLRSKSLNTTLSNSETNICQSNIFQTSTNCHCVFFFPIESFLDLPFNGLIGGKVYFSYKNEDKSLQVTFWSDFFESGKNSICECNRSCSLWQVDELAEYLQKYLLHTKIFILKDSHIKLVQIGNFQYLLKNAKIQFVFKDRSLGLFFLRTEEQDQSSQEGETDPISSSMQSSTSQSSSWTTNLQAISSQHMSINMPYPQPSLSQTSSWITNPHGSMGIPYTQPYAQEENPPHASMQMQPFYTGEFPRQGALDSSQLTLEDDVDQISANTCEQLNVILQDVSTDALLTLEDINQISENTWEQLNVILQDVSTESLLESLKDAENG